MKNPLKLYYILSVFLLMYCRIQAQQDYRIEKLSIDDGLSQSSVKCILQDSAGFMWFGTAAGLNRYDGYSFKVYENNPADPSSITDNFITALYEDNAGTLWVGTSDGVLNEYIRQKDSFKHYRFPYNKNTVVREYYELPLPFSRINSNSVIAISEDKRGDLWLASWGNGIAKFDKKKGRFVRLSGSEEIKGKLSSLIISDFLIDDNGVFWITALGEGLVRIRINEISGKIESFNIIASAARYRKKLTALMTVLEDKNKNLWLGSFTNGVFFIPGENKDKDDAENYIINYNNDNNSGLISNSVMALMEDSAGSIWTGSFNDGVSKFDNTRNRFTSLKNELGHNRNLIDGDILSLYEDRAGMLWIGSQLGTGITKLEKNKKKFHLINEDVQGGISLNDNVVWAVYEDKNSNLWVGTYRGGLNKINRKAHTIKVYKNNPSDAGSISQNYIRSICEDYKGNLWVGTYSRGINILRKGSNKFERYASSSKDDGALGADQVQTIYVSRDSTVWLGTYGGGLNKAVILPNGRIKFIKYKNDPSDSNSLSDNRVYAIYEDKDGDMWIGTFGGGLNKFDRKTGKFKRYNRGSSAFSLSDERICSIYEDKYGNLWLGTFGGGLNSFDKKNEIFTRYASGEGLIPNVIYGILEDGANNNLWLSSDNGLVKFNVLTESYVRYDMSDGAQSEEFSGGAYFKNKSGEMFFGGISGLNYFYPDSVKDNLAVPQIAITSINVRNKKLTGIYKDLTLNYNQNFISFEFAALDYHLSLKNLYAYKLDGVDDDWHFTNGQRRFANYIDLSPGEYTFRVKGSNNDGIWNNNGTSLHIVILKPFWKTWWFIFGLAVMLLMVILYFATLRIRNAASIRKLKERLSADLHDNIGSGLTEISILSELALQKIDLNPYEASKKVRNISDTSRQLIDAMSDIIWVVNPKTDSLYDLFIRLKADYADLLSSSNISFKCGDMEALKNVKLSMEYRQNLFLIFKEGINNSIKHSGCRNIFFDAKLNGKILKIILRDDGKGFNKDSQQYGNGLFNMKKRTKNIGGEIIWNASVSKGSEIIFKGKLNFLNIGKDDDNTGTLRKYNLKGFSLIPSFKKRII